MLFHQNPEIMKANRNLLCITSFLIGAGIGIGIFALVAFSSVAPPYRPQTIEPTIASQYTKNYIDAIGIPKEKLRAFTLDTAQVAVMKYLMDNDKTIPGFRIYLAIKDSKTLEKVGIIVAIDRIENDVLSAVYQTSGGHLGPCPNVCDRIGSTLSH